MALNKNGLQEKESFLKEWPIERLKAMTLEEYTNREKSTAFVYWLEATTTNYGSIWGGSAYKFGIFSRENTKNEVNGTMRQTDGTYSWLGKYGSSAQEAFDKVKELIIDVATASSTDALELIDDIDLGNAVKWKIAALYSPSIVVPLYAEKMLTKAALELGLTKKESKTISNVQRALFKNKGEESVLELAENYWTKYNAENASLEDQFKAYMDRLNMAQKTIGSYIRGNKFTSGFLKDHDQVKNDIYEVESLAELKELSEYLQENKEFTEKNNKDHHLYSAALNKYIEFFETTDGINNNDDIGDLENFKSGPNFKSYIEHLRSLVAKLKLTRNDSRVVYSVTRDRLTFTIGQRYCFTLYTKEKRGNFGVITTSPISETISEFEGKDSIAYLNFFDQITLSDHEWEMVVEASKNELARSTKSGYKKFNNTDFENYVFQVKKENRMEVLNIPKNLILYGPPGTGKTYRLTNDYFNLFTEKKKLITKEDKFKVLVDKYSWWEVITLCMLDMESGKVPQLFNHPLMQIKVESSDTKSPKNTLWSLLQTYTKQDCPYVNLSKRRDPEIFWKDENSVWSVDKEIVKEQLPEIHDDFLWMNTIEAEESVKERFVTVTFHQSYSYEDFIEGIKPVLDESNSENSDVGYRIEPGVFKKICTEARIEPDKPYAIFIDEINRGNVASVFGELITLIEEDKREGEENEISLELPYSKKKFSVPSNLHIIGTMNTADRSVEALDTALRRRFSFIEMLPNPSLIKEGKSKGKIAGFDLEKMLSVINQRIEVLVDRDHTIGHAFFMGVDSLESLQVVIADKIVPLLQEYFYGDYKKMEMVMGTGFFEKKAIDKIAFAVEEDVQFEGSSYTILDAKTMTEEEFENAMKLIKF